MAGGLSHGWLHGIAVGIAGAIRSGQQHGRCGLRECGGGISDGIMIQGSEKEVDFAPEISEGFPSRMMN